MATRLPVNATSADHAERIARDAFSRLRPDFRVTALELVGIEPSPRPFDRVALAETGATACYIFTVAYTKVDR